MARIYIVAGSGHQALEWAHSVGISRSEMVFVSSPNSLRGVYDPLVAYVGTYYARKDLHEIQEMVAYIKRFSRVHR